MKNKIIKISIVGKTNSGKSTLLNKIVGEKVSIQNKKINTTQEVIIGIKNIKNTQMLFYESRKSLIKLKVCAKNGKPHNVWLMIFDFA